MSQEPRLKSYAFRPSLESMLRFKDASPEAKLNWLEEANRFVNDFVPKEKLERWKKLTGK